MTIIGDAQVGKSSFLRRAVDGDFDPRYISTIGIDFKTTTVTFNKSRVKLQLWDTAGGGRFSEIARSYYKGANVIFLMYDVQNRDSFQHLDSYWQRIQKDGKKDVPCILLANKADPETDEADCKDTPWPEAVPVPAEEGLSWAQKHNMKFYEISCKAEDIGYTSRFQEILACAVELCFDPAASLIHADIQFKLGTATLSGLAELVAIQQTQVPVVEIEGKTEETKAAEVRRRRLASLYDQRLMELLRRTGTRKPIPPAEDNMRSALELVRAHSLYQQDEDKHGGMKVRMALLLTHTICQAVHCLIPALAAEIASFLPGMQHLS